MSDSENENKIIEEPQPESEPKEQPVAVPQKEPDGYVKNPLTNRLIKQNGKTYKQLIRKGLLADVDHNIVGEFNESESTLEVDKKISKLTDTSNPDQYVVRGRGSYKNKLVKTKARTSIETINKNASKVSARVIRDNINELVQSDDIQADLERLIHQELLKNSSKQSKKTKSKYTKRKVVIEESSSEEESEEESESSESEYFE